MDQIYLFALAAALNPTLLAATTVMLVLPNPKRLLLGYLLGALMTSITLGLLIVFSLDGSSSGTSTAKQTINPVWDVVLGALILVVAFRVGTSRDTRLRARRERKRAGQTDKAPPKWQEKRRALRERRAVRERHDPLRRDRLRIAARPRQGHHAPAVQLSRDLAAQHSREVGRLGVVAPPNQNVHEVHAGRPHAHHRRAGGLGNVGELEPFRPAELA